MREYSFDLKKHKGISGELVLLVPTYRKRLMMVKDCNFKINSDGEMETGVETIESIVKLLDVTKPHFKTVDLKCGDIHVKSFDEMEEWTEFDGLLTEAAGSVLNAGRLGK